MSEPEGAPARRWPFEGYGLALLTLGSFLALTVVARMFYPFLPFFLVSALTVVTAAAARPFPRFEAQLSRWLLAAAFVAMAVVTLSTLPEEVHPNEGPRCPGSGAPLCAELKEWWDEHLRARGQHERGIAVLGWSSLVAAGVLGARFWQVLVASSPPSPRSKGGGISSVKDGLPRLLSIAILASNGLALWALWWAVAWEMRES